MAYLIRIFAFAILAAAAVAGLALARTQVPGSEGDPIVTKSYVDMKAVWETRTVELNTFYKLATGCEIVVAEVEGGLDELSLKDANLGECKLLDLTTGERLDRMVLSVGHHYLVGPGKEARLTFNGSGTVMTRGLAPEE